MSKYKLINLFRLKLFQAGYGAGYSIKEEYFEIVRIHYQFRLDFDKSSGFLLFQSNRKLFRVNVET